MQFPGSLEVSYLLLHLYLNFINIASNMGMKISPGFYNSLWQLNKGHSLLFPNHP